MARKTLDDLPVFRLDQIRKGETRADGFTRYELEGEFDRPVKKTGEISWFNLLIGDGSVAYPMWKVLAPNGRTATLVLDEKESPDLAKKVLRYLSPRWDAFNVWMVIDEEWGWQRVRFQAVDAVAETFVAKDVSIVDGREVKTWTKLERADKRGGTERYAPNPDGISSPSSAQRIIPAGWDHEHCELCRSHIDHGQFGYRDSKDDWLCESCYGKYVKPHNLAFIDEL